MVSYPLVFVIVLNYEGIDYLNACLLSLESQTYPNFRVVVFDNAAVCGSADLISKSFPKVSLLRSEENFGFAKGNNLAIKYVLEQEADYVFLLNNDTALEKGLVEKLVNILENDGSIGIVGPAVFDYKNKNFNHELGMSVDKFAYPLSLRDLNISNKSSKVFFVSGCAMMIRADLLRCIGCFDEKYFMFVEDLDLCWRAQLAGYRVVMDGSARIYHASGASISGGVIKTTTYKTNAKRVFLREKNTLRTLIKNYNGRNILTVVLSYLALLSFESIFWTFFFKPRTSLSILRAVLWNVRHFSDTLLQRARVQRLRTTPDSEIVKRMIKGYGKLYVYRLIGMPQFVTFRT